VRKSALMCFEGQGCSSRKSWGKNGNTGGERRIPCSVLI
jgi:hypothetical protein